MDVNAKLSGYGKIVLSNAKDLIAGRLHAGRLFEFPVVILWVYDDDKRVIYHAQCLPLGISEQDYSQHDAFIALTDTVEAIICDNSFDEEKIRAKYRPSEHFYYVALERLKKIGINPWLTQRYPTQTSS